jgi:hypothetical protein
LPYRTYKRFEEIMTDEELIAKLDSCDRLLLQHERMWPASVAQESRDRLKQLTEVKAPADGSVVRRVAVSIGEDGVGEAWLLKQDESPERALRLLRGQNDTGYECIAIVSVPRMAIQTVQATIEEPE